MIELGFQNWGLLVVFLSGLITSFVIRWKWNKSVERRREIMRLVAMAADEAARAELQANAEYQLRSAAVPVALPVVRQSDCAVCHSPTTTRCSRCKAVKYCSGKCQIIHWRLGHKDECHPPDNTLNGPDSDNDRKVVSQGDQHEVYVNHAVLGETCADKPIETYAEEHDQKNSLKGNQHEAYMNDTEIKGSHTDNPIETYAVQPRSTETEHFTYKGDDVVDKTSSVSDNFSVSSPLEFPATTVDEPLVGVSITERPLPNHEDRPEEPLFSGIAYDVADKTTDVSGIKLTKSSPSECSTFDNEPSVGVSLTDLPISSPGDGLEEPRYNGITPDAHHTEVVNGIKLSELSSSEYSTFSSSADDMSRSESTSSSGSSFDILSRSKFSDPPISNLEFWETSLNSHAYGNGTDDDSTISSFSEGGEDNQADSKSLPGFTVNTSQQDVSYSQTQNDRGRNRLKSSSRVPLSEKTLTNMSMHKRSQTMESEKPSSTNGISSDSQLLGLRGARSISTSAKPAAGDMLNSRPVGPAGTKNSNGDNGVKASARKVIQQLKVYKPSKHHATGYAEKYNYKMVFPYEVFIKLYHWNNVELRPCGLKNCGNRISMGHFSLSPQQPEATLQYAFRLSDHYRLESESCYANVVLQCLSFTRPLTAYLYGGFHSKACPKKEWCFMCEFEALILKVKEGKSPISPISILSHLESTGSHLGHGREEDAHEFLRCVIETMQSVCLKEAGENAVGPLAEETTLIGLIFGGYLQSKIKCMKCHGKSERRERMMDLTVEIEGDIRTLEEALKQFTAAEILEKENKYNCLRCNSYEKAKKTLTILEAPNVLTIVLKRFQSGKNGKLNKPVRFPEILDLFPYMSGTSDKSPIYSLYAVVVHRDMDNATFSGHYVCYVKIIQGRWFILDDSRVEPVEVETVLSERAYMLLYARCSPRAPSSIKKIKGIISTHSETVTSRSRPGSVGPRSGLFTGQKRDEDYHNWTTSDGPTSFESFDSFDRRFHPMHRIPRVYSSSDNSSLLSCSDEGSCSTESTRDSGSIDDLPDYIFGEAGYWNSSLKAPADSYRVSPLSASERHASGLAETSGYPHRGAGEVFETDEVSSSTSGENGRRREGLQDKGSQRIFDSDMTKQDRKLTHRSNSNNSSGSGSGSKESELQRVGPHNPLNVNSSISQRRFSRERTKTFY